MNLLKTVICSKRSWYFGAVSLFIVILVLQKQSKMLNANASHIETSSNSPSFFERDGYCHNKTAHKSIFYIKIQKTGSSTIKSSLLNYGLKHNMMICLDSTDLYHLNFPYPIDESKLTKSSKQKCELVADELVFNQKQVFHLMKNVPVVIASVRDPAKHFISLYKFARIHEAVQLLSLSKLDFWDGIRTFLKNSQLVKDVYNTLEEENFGKLAHLIRPSLQTYSLGLKPEATKEEINKRVHHIDFFIVAEKYFESMVLLAKTLCCPFEDLVFVRQNIQQQLPEEKEQIPSDVLDMIKSYNRADYLLYKMANQKLDDFTNKHSLFMNLDVVRYKNIIRQYARQCETTRIGLAKVKGNYCLPEQATYFYKAVQGIYKKKLLANLQAQFDKLNP